MLLALVFILLLVWAAVVGSLYSNFIIFYKSFSEIDNYNKAYYASIAALERWELVTKQREPGYIWSGWWRWANEINLTNNITDKIDGSDFSYLVESDDTNLLRDVNSRTNRVPRQWEWDVDWMLADSTDYNKMDYEDAEVFLLYIDDSGGSPYTKKSCSNDGDCSDSQAKITWQIRLPSKMRSGFWWWWDKWWNLDNLNSLVVNWNKDDEIVDWQLRWKYNGSQFTIFARNKAIISGNVQAQDSVIRESDLNMANWVTLSFWDNQYRRQPNTNKGQNSSLIIIGSEIENNLSGKNFGHILDGNNDYSRLNLRLSLLNLLKSKSAMIYPYLEYYLNFDQYVSDKYFRIDGEGRYKDYQVNIIMYKPTVKESVLWNFTVIF